MQIGSKVNVANSLRQGRQFYVEHFISFFKYALLAVFVSYIVSIYVAVFDTWFLNYPVIYVMGLVLLLLLYFPIVYYSIRLTITNAEKLKAMFNNETYRYDKGFQRSKDKFWRVFVILVIRFFLKTVAIASLGIPILNQVALKKPEILNFTLDPGLTPWTFVFGVIGLVTSVYLLIRFEFATIVVFWDIESGKSDLKTSMMLTKTQLFDKLKVMLVAHIPGLVLSAISLAYIFYNQIELAASIKWIYVVLSVTLNTVFYSWLYAFYYPLLGNMKCMMAGQRKTIDEKGREWLSF